MQIKGDGLGADARVRGAGTQQTEQTDATRAKQAVRDGKPVPGQGSKADAIDISPQARELQTEAVSRGLQADQAPAANAAPGRVAATGDAEPTSELPAHLAAIRDKVAQGFYDNNAVLQEVTDRLMQDLGLPAPDSQDGSDEGR